MILETTRIRGILAGRRGRASWRWWASLADQRIQPGEKVLTAGGDLIFPRGLPVGVVEKVVRDPERDGLIDIIVKPAAHLDRLDEVLVITSTEPRFSPQEQQDLAASESQKGAVPAAIKDQVKASEIMAERLPGLIDPNLPPDQQPLARQQQSESRSAAAAAAASRRVLAGRGNHSRIGARIREYGARTEATDPKARGSACRRQWRQTAPREVSKPQSTPRRNP